MSGLKDFMKKIKKEMVKVITDEQIANSANDNPDGSFFAFFRKQHGSILIISALMLPLMLGCLGFAYDFGNLYIHKTRLQNVADAAALAGGRAYLESQKNTDVRLRDKTDELPTTEEGLYGGEWEQKSYQPGLQIDGITWEGNHPSADRAADINIYNNIINLGTVVKTDEYSHYALKSEGSNYKIFYRIGLYEEVPLHFLSLILNKKEQRVRAGAVVLMDDGSGFSIGNTLFDNLFTVKNGITLNSGVAVDNNSINSTPSEGGATIQATFDGKIAIANEDSDNWKWAKANKGESYYIEEEKAYQYFYTDKEKNYNNGMVYKDGKLVHVSSQEHSINEINSTPNRGGRAVRDNSIGIDSSVSGFLNKLTEPHADLKKNCNVALLSKSIKTKELDTYKSKDVHIRDHYTISKTENDVTYVTNYYHKEVTQIADYDIIKYISCVPRGDRHKWSPGEANSEEMTSGEDYEISPGDAYVLYDYPSIYDEYDIKNNNPAYEKDYYYHFYTEGKEFKNTYSNFYPQCFTYVLDEDNNKIFFNISYNSKTKKPQIDLYRKKLIENSTEYEYWQLNKQDDYNKIAGNTTNKDTYLIDKTVNLAEEKITYRYHERLNGSIIKTVSIPIVKKQDINFSNGRRVNDNQINHSAIYHLEQDGFERGESSTKKYNFLFEVNGMPGEEYQPLYVIVTGNKGRPIKINVTDSNIRPIIFCNLTTNEISEFSIKDDKIFKGSIYSPYAKVVNTVPAATGTKGRKFIGNIIAKELEIQDAGTTWTHKNFLENDGDLNIISDAEAKEQEKRKKTATDYAKTKFIDYAMSTLSLSEAAANAAWNDPAWFSTLNETQQSGLKSFWNTKRQELWNDTGLDMPDWPWTDGGATDTQHYNNKDDEPTGEKLRLINFRTEYTTEPYYNPFNSLRLSPDE